MAKYLDQTGLQHLLTGLRGKFVEQDKIVNDYLNKVNLKAENVAYRSTNMEGVEDVKGALDVLVANVVRQENDALAAAANMKDLAAVVDKLDGADTVDGSVKQQIKAVVDAQKTTDDEQNERLDTLEGLVVGGEGEGIAAVIADVATNTAAIAKLNGDENTAGSVAKAVKDAQDAQATIDAAQNEEIGKKVAQADYDAKVKELKGAIDAINVILGQDDVEGGTIVERVDSLESNVNTIDAKLAGLEKDTVQAAIDQAQADAETKAAELDATLKTELQAEIDADVKVVADALANEKDATKDGSLAKQIADEATARENADNALGERIAALETATGEGGSLEARVAANEEAIGVINGSGEGSIAKALQDAKDYADGKDTAIAAAQAAADAAQAAADAAQEDINAFMAAAEVGDAAIDTLKEIQDYITTDGEAAAALTARVAANETAINAINNAETGILKQAKDYADTAVANEATAREAADDALSKRIATLEGNGEGSVAAQVNAVQEALDEFEEAQKAKEETQDNKIAALETIVGTEEDEADATTVFGAIAAEKARAEAAEKVNADAIAEMKDESKENTLAYRIAALEEANGEDGAVTKDIEAAQAAADAAQAAADAAQGEVDALEAIVGKAAEGEKAATGLFKAIADEADRAKGVEEGLGSRIEALEAIEHHNHDNKDVLDGISAEKVAAWDAAEQNAKTYVDTKMAEITALTSGEIDNAITAAFTDAPEAEQGE